HPELLAFKTWAQVQEHAALDDASGSLKVLVKLVDDHGPEELIRVVSTLVDEQHADVIISTGHRAKGREWDRVRIGADFREPRRDRLTGRALWRRDELMLAYVAVTRARRVLDRGGLAWLDDYDRGPVQGPETWLTTAVREHPDAILADQPDPYGLDDVDELAGIGSDYRTDPAERIAAVAAIAPEYVRPVEPKPAAVVSPFAPAPRKPRCACAHLQLVHVDETRACRACSCRAYAEAREAVPA
ncbi:hypothetical protein ADL19_23470, partial [Streptomyces purpurogeneiscleroticus]